MDWVPTIPVDSYIRLCGVAQQHLYTTVKVHSLLHNTIKRLQDIVSQSPNTRRRTCEHTPAKLALIQPGKASPFSSLLGSSSKAMCPSMTTSAAFCCKAQLYRTQNLQNLLIKTHAILFGQSPSTTLQIFTADRRRNRQEKGPCNGAPLAHQVRNISSRLQRIRARFVSSNMLPQSTDGRWLAALEQSLSLYKRMV